MEISFKTNQLEKDLNSAKRLRKKYGDARARYIMRRMKILAASPTLAEVPHQPPERCHQLTGDRNEQFGVTIKDQWRIVFRVNHEPIPRKEDNGIDLSKITKITITWIGDYHD
jgi:proteic killer suppression protein